MPTTDDQKLFEFILLEGAQAGLSWETILNKREGYRKAFENFNPRKVSLLKDGDFERLIKNPDIVRNKLKIKSAINNAKAFLKIQSEFGSFAKYMWAWTDNKVVLNYWKNDEEIPAVTNLATEMSKDLKKRGFSFLGPTIWYAHMQACGMVNDHIKDCFRYNEVEKLGKSFKI